jgi:LysR substrate binding domain.
MRRENVSDLLAFLAVARERSFTNAAQPHLERGTLVRVLEDWCPPFAGYHLYYPSRRQSSPAFDVLVQALRYRG